MAEDEKELDIFFAAARRETARLPDALADRMMADAGHVQRERARFGSTARSAMSAPARVLATGQSRAEGWLAQLREMIGGWYGMGGMVAACAAGVWLGFAPPSGLPDPASLLGRSDASVDLFSTETLAVVLTEDH
ncbi:hypothetical protein [Albibacillus kandeliae]|uniref:hypothetical protein n=1 Tax=Albibacillus kandeliae TaxID=2174228 RepID=UPI0018E574A4|nr:hypothetical protein [Albibacillus kandeliae]